ncbi:MAG: hypothetical protein ACJASV_000803 [Pseudorhodobacter sp.]|jgi:uncharacterized protein (DUF2147 family)
MKTGLLAIALIFAAGVAHAADPLEGVWQTKPDDNGNFGHVQVKPCGTKFCGTLIKSFDSNSKETKSENIGKRIIWDMQAQGDGNYGKGKVWSPDRDKTYNSKIKLSGSTLGVEGCVFGICRDGGQWSRVK